MDCGQELRTLPDRLNYRRSIRPAILITEPTPLALDHSRMSGAIICAPFTMPLPLSKHALDPQSALRFELDRLRELGRQPLDDQCLEQLEPIFDTLAKLYRMTQVGHSEEDWQKLVMQCEHAFVRAWLRGLTGEFEACIHACWAALENAGIVHTPRSESV